MGKEKRLSLGVYPDVSFREAREKRDEARKMLADGIDPAEQRKAEKAARVDKVANSFEAIAREWYGKHLPTWAPNHSGKLLRLFERDVFPWLGARPIADIREPQLLAVARRIEARGALAGRSKTP